MSPTPVPVTRNTFSIPVSNAQSPQRVTTETAPVPQLVRRELQMLSLSFTYFEKALLNLPTDW